MLALAGLGGYIVKMGMDQKAAGHVFLLLIQENETNIAAGSKLLVLLFLD